MSTLLRQTTLRTLPSIRRTFSTTPLSSSFAKMTLVGRLVAQPELQATSTGREILKYSVATSHGPRDNQKTSFFNVTSFMPEGAGRDFRQGLEKGTLVYVEGDASISQYQDAEGKNRSSLSVVERTLEVLAYRKPAETEATPEAAAAH
ncbi:nucleic acid-binding protein [Mollisia scopiformis]|uniref:Nucleic acid-binding protein n=1 Tax=Mollisia scopiformis TaxID=149040 RepID=A0A194WXT3_MOLSC|nr:nucleic acid-binding protein [Mollisia scopiformis]KUJ12740.1 nucleic acid-binding protein [Mollisia scopiformis]